jgi:sec-independent protein translocase protein TatA
MPQIGPLELIIVLVIALLVLGPGRLPDVGAALGKSIREFRKATSDVQEATKIDVTPLPPTSTATPVPSAPVATPVAAATTPSPQPPAEPQA